MILLVDMDGTTTDLEGRFWEVWGEMGYPVVPPEYRTNWDIVSDLPPELRDKARQVFGMAGLFASCKPIDGAIEGVHTLLNAGVDVRFCTAPLRGSVENPMEKLEWVDRWYGQPILDRVIQTRDKTYVRGDYLLDDKPVVTGSLKPTWTHVVFGDWPYQNGVKGPRVRTWDEAVAKFADGKL